MLKQLSKTLSTGARYYSTSGTPYTLPDLPYDYGALEPVISGDIMKLHHQKHHQAYVTNLNVSLEKYAKAEEAKDVATMIQLQSAIKFNGGGHVNHSIFWKNLAPKNQLGGVAPEGPLADAINKQFGSLDKLIDKMSATTLAIQGSGWGWLGYDKATDKLVITTQANQDPLSISGLTPLLGLDVWEHAYYLQYKNVRADYLKNIWQIVNWRDVAERYNKAK
ncbi:superoxide dismutase [Tieghemostelium lacteum]|uniref:Superoxide dismutase n=1 Tax=Tieghemostelium lacteum TaxID=361077 RepID=A0A151ZF37_TIELA|nr:superoxide dismutase [Tieghemostelium lacteum]|eukprot:KYQ92537.1 superoxide dismutase [Tieghemostelium lacteum]